MTKILSSRPVFHAKLFTVYEDSLELNTGSKRVYHHVSRNPAVSVFPITEKFEIYLVDQYRYLHEGRLIEAVAGMIDEGEEPLETAQRELSEEVGIVAREWKQLAKLKAAGSIVSWSQFLFLARDLQFADAHPEESEDIQMIKMSLDEAVEKVLNGEINTGSTAIGVMMIDELKRRGKL